MSIISIKVDEVTITNHLPKTSQGEKSLEGVTRGVFETVGHHFGNTQSGGAPCLTGSGSIGDGIGLGGRPPPKTGGGSSTTLMTLPSGGIYGGGAPPAATIFFLKAKTLQLMLSSMEKARDQKLCSDLSSREESEDETTFLEMRDGYLLTLNILQTFLDKGEGEDEEAHHPIPLPGGFIYSF